MKQERPNFQTIGSFDEFSRYYWYREELVAICRQLGIEYCGTKKELNNYIAEYFKGNKIPHQPALKVKGKVVNNRNAITLSSSLLESGFALNDTFRNFFAKQVGVSTFKFTADMATAWRKVKQTHNTSFTFYDMLKVYDKSSNYAKYDNSSCQWNKFLKDFCTDEQNCIFKNKLKAAAILWKQVRDSTHPKVYSHELVDTYKELLKDYQ